jgi:radical SAM protein with 4Fe4S-binding SPASM domain
VNSITSLNIELLGKCLLECRHCSSSSSFIRNDKLDIRYIKQLLIEGSSFGAGYLSISGGEPLLYEDLFNVLTLARDLKYKVRIYTSGIIGNIDSLKAVDTQFLQKIKAFNNVEAMIFSLHAPSAEIHDYITQRPGSFDFTVEAIQRAIAVGLVTEVHTVPMSVNYALIPKLIRFAEECGVSELSLLRLVPQGRCTENKHLIMNGAETAQFTKLVNKLDSHVLSIRKGAPYRCLFLNEAGVCSAGVDKLLISPDGSVHPCEAFKFTESDSNIYDKSLKEIWETDRILNEIRNLSIEQINVCNQCPNVNKCSGGCPGQRLLEYKNVLIGPDPICMVNPKL